jgi:hypothetical protein
MTPSRSKKGKRRSAQSRSVRDGRIRRDPERNPECHQRAGGCSPPRTRSRAESHRGLRTPGWRARRWIIEACHSWLNCNRALLIRWSKKDQNHLALLQLASGRIAFKKARLATLTATQPA